MLVANGAPRVRALGNDLVDKLRPDPARSNYKIS
jgi:hypothetical protein